MKKILILLVAAGFMSASCGKNTPIGHETQTALLGWEKELIAESVAGSVNSSGEIEIHWPDKQTASIDLPLHLRIYAYDNPSAFTFFLYQPITLPTMPQYEGVVGTSYADFSAPEYSFPAGKRRETVTTVTLLHDGDRLNGADPSGTNQGYVIKIDFDLERMAGHAIPNGMPVINELKLRIKKGTGYNAS